jgi:hypothetical protein
MASQKQADSAFQVTQALSEQLTDTGRQLNATHADFLRVDVETALTFSGLALETDNNEKRQRNRKNARKAYDTILRLGKNVTLTPAQAKHMQEKISRLKRELELLGDKF